MQIEIPLPDKAGRREILQIHFEALRRRGRLSEPLCRAIDGSNTNNEDGSGGSPTFKSMIQGALRSVPSGRIKDLAAEGVTGNFSGADLQGLVRCAGSLALARTRRQGMGVEGLIITLEDVVEALAEVKT